MRKIEKAFCHLNLETFKSGKVKDWAKPFRNEEIIKSTAMKVATYDELVGLVARILHYNRQYVIFYRGQGREYKSEAGCSLIPPSIFRENKSKKPRQLKRRFEILKQKSEKLIEVLKSASGLRKKPKKRLNLFESGFSGSFFFTYLSAAKHNKQADESYKISGKNHPFRRF